jgi:tRNA G18 (ribose-2'-O)-methylase SpoU
MRVVEIEGLRDPRVAVYRNVRDADLRAREGLFLAEGRLNVKRLLSGSPFRPHSVFVTPSGLAWLRETLESLDRDVPVYVARQSVLNEIVGYDMHRGCLAAARRSREIDFEALRRETARRRLWLVLEDVTNPDNVGGIFRSGLPFARARRWPGELAELSAAGFRVIALDASRDALPLDSLALPKALRGVALVVGNEGEGLSQRALAAADARLTIPMAAGVDSLNAATAAGIALQRLATELSLV